MKKNELVGRLRKFSEKTSVRRNGQKPLSLFFVKYFEKLDIYSDKEIIPLLPGLIIGALEKLRTGTDKTAIYYRNMYKEEVGKNIPNIIDFGKSDEVERNSIIELLDGIISSSTELKLLESKIYTYCCAQQNVAKQAFDKFIHQVYHRGLSEIIKGSGQQEMSGRFGNTILQTSNVAKGSIFTFTCKKEKSVISVSFTIATHNGQIDIQSSKANLCDCLEMIGEVTKCWTETKKEKSKIFTPEFF